MVPTLNEIVEEMIQRAELSQASQTSLVPEAETLMLENKEHELDKLLAPPTKPTAKKPVPLAKELAHHEQEGNQIVCQ